MYVTINQQNSFIVYIRNEHMTGGLLDCVLAWFRRVNHVSVAVI